MNGSKSGLHKSRKLKGPNYQHKFAAGRKSLFHFDVEVLLQCGRSSGTTIAYSRSRFCNIFNNWKSSRGPQEKLSRAVCCASLLKANNFFKDFKDIKIITLRRGC